MKQRNASKGFQRTSASSRLKIKRSHGKQLPTTVVHPVIAATGLILFTLAGVSQPCHGANTGNVIADKITVVGTKALTSSAVTIAASVQPGQSLSEDEIASIHKRLIDTGLFGMHHPDDPDEAVRLRIETTGYPKGHGELLIIVDENDAVKNFSIIGSGPITPDEIRKHLHSGGVFSTEQLYRDRRTIQEMYHAQGYLATFGQDLGMDPEHPGILNVPIIIARVRDIRISGNKVTRAFVVRREIKTHEGAYFNRRELASDTERLGKLGVFSDVDPQVEVVSPDQVSIQIRLKENKLRTYNFGSSYGGGALAGFVEVSDNNFRGQDESLGVHIENGVNSNRHSYQLSFSEPYIDRNATSMRVSAYDTSSSMFANTIAGIGSSVNGGSLVQQKAGGSIELDRSLGSGFSVSAAIRGESIHTDPLSLAGSSAALLQDGPLGSVTGLLSHSTLDQRHDPHSGALQVFSLMTGHSTLTTAALSSDPVAAAAAGSHTFARGSLDLQRFITLQGPLARATARDNRTVLAMRFQAAITAGTTPFTEQLFVGGATGLRGYRDGRFWGQNMTTGTIELRQPLGNGIKGILFAEAGDAWGGVYKGVLLQGLQQSGFKLHGSAGLGIRVGTPMGLLRLDYGMGDEGGRVHFGIGYSF